MKKMRLSSRLLIAFASLAMTAAFFLPVWFIFLLAPQYPEGLTMQIWLNRLSGQVDIINGLNHYIGMKHINQEMFPEFTYMPYGLAAFIVFGLVVAISGSRRLLMALLLLSLVTAAAAMYDFYKWGYDYGHNLDPKAAIKVPGLTYQPPVVGHKTLLNFDAYSYPDVGGWIIIGAGALFFLVYFLEWLRRRKASVKTVQSKTVAALIAGCVLLFSSCTTGPKPFAYGKDVCDDCKMTVMEPHFGAQLMTAKGRIYKFDDAHCLANFLKSGKLNSQDIRQTVFVDYENEKAFLDAAAAWFVVSPQLKSPMNSNAGAFASEKIAGEKAAAVSGKVVIWNELQKSLQER